MSRVLDKGFRAITVRRNVERRILRFSLCFGIITTAIAGFVYVAALRANVRNLQQKNQEALAEMPCDVDGCQSNKFTTDPYTDSPDYIIDPKTRYYLTTPGTTPETATRLASLDFVDPEFVQKYRQPESYNSLDGERWRLLSRPATFEGKPVEVIVGYAEKQPTKILEASSRDLPSIDKRLRQESDEIAANLAKLGEPSGRVIRSAPKFSADGFTVLYANTGEVVDWGLWLPTFLPSDKEIPALGRRLVRNGPDIDFEQVDTNGRLIAVSLASLGDLRWFCVVVVALLTLSTLVARYLSQKFLRSYFLFSQTRVPTLVEALRQGEGTHVEFKRGLSDDEGGSGAAEEEFLKTVAAFANSGDGVIFIGIDDTGKAKGLDLDATSGLSH